jgi:hypothetical protein
MRFDDRAANRQPYAQATGLGRLESRENAREVRRRQPQTRIAHSDKHIARLGLTGADQQLARSVPDLAQRFNGIHDVQHHLLELDLVPPKRVAGPTNSCIFVKTRCSDIATGLVLMSKIASLTSRLSVRTGAFLGKSRSRTAAALITTFSVLIWR